MKPTGAPLFAWLQGAPFYAQAHRQAVALLPRGEGRSWTDVGCGPGLVARLAHEHGYDALGIDRDPGMIRAARRAAPAAGCRFAVGDLQAAANGPGADVVSAASLLYVLPDRAAGLDELWRCVRPGGHLLIVETTARMDLEHVRAAAAKSPRGRRFGLWLWAWVRRGRQVDRALFAGLDAVATERRLLLDGLLEAWVFTKGAA